MKQLTIRALLHKKTGARKKENMMIYVPGAYLDKATRRKQIQEEFGQKAKDREVQPKREIDLVSLFLMIAGGPFPAASASGR